MKKIYFIKIMTAFLLFPLHTGLWAQQQKKDPQKVFRQKLVDISAKFAHKADSAILIFNQLLATPDVEQDVTKTTFVYLAIGREYRTKKNNIGKTLDYYTKAAALADKSGDCSLQIWTLIFLNQCYFDLKNFDIFFKNYEKAAAIYEQCPQSDKGLYIYTILGINYRDLQGDWVRAEKNLLKADSILEHRKDFDYSAAQFTYTSLINFYSDQKNTTKTMYYAQKAKGLHVKKLSHVDKIDLSSYSFIIDIFKNIGELDSALYYAHTLARQPLQEYSEINKEFIYRANNELANLYALKHDTSKALFYKEIYANYLDSLAGMNKTDVARQTIQSLSDQLTIEKKQQQIDRNNLILSVIGVLAFFVLIFVSILYFYAQKLKNANTLLEAQKEELSALNALRTTMFSVLAHDLKSPIGGLQGMLDMFHKGFISQEEFKNHTVDLKNNINGLVGTLNNILNWSYIQLNGKKPFIESLNVRQIVEEQCDLQLGAARKKKIELNNYVPNDFKISADFNQLSLIIRNLLDNAIKYTLEGGKVEIQALDTEGGKMIKIKDTGIGMDAEKIQNLFTIHPNDTKTLSLKNKGVGLGLQMVNDLMKANNCTISVVSKENEGSVFSVLFKN